jgi:hypothetical protein
MTKSKKNKRIKKVKRGGDGISTSTQPSSSNNGLMSWFTNAWNTTKKTSEGLMNQAQSVISKPSSNTTPNPTTSSNTSNTSLTSSSTIVPSSTTSSSSSTLVPSTGSFTSSTIEGGRKSRQRRKKAGSYARVHGLSVAKPTYYLTGGKSTRRRRRKH